MTRQKQRAIDTWKLISPFVTLKDVTTSWEIITILETQLQLEGEAEVQQALKAAALAKGYDPGRYR